ncbi:MAG: alpha/beta hydrolase [Burkholderiales bacterium]
MPYALSDDVRLYVEDSGSGVPIVFVHELAGDYRCWEQQVRFLGRRYRCITYNARGYPPSDVPPSPDAYSQRQAVEDIANVMRDRGIDRAHVVGLSMGGYATLNFGIAYPEKVRSLVVAGAGHGSDPDKREAFFADCTDLAERIQRLGMAEGIRHYANSAVRRRYREKDPRGFDEFNGYFGEHSPLGTALTIRGCQMRRPTVYELGDRLAALTMPVLIITGDDDAPCLAPALYLKRTIPDSQLWVVPRTSHPINLEEPDAFNRTLLDFFTSIDGRA